MSGAGHKAVVVATRYALKLTPPAVVLEYAEKDNRSKIRLRTVRPRLPRA
jgi:hypothetical protein